MAEEPQSAPTTPVQQPQTQNNVIPDSILQEIEKVAKMEKDITFLQHRQGSVEKSLTNLKDSLGENQEKTPATENNVIPNEEDKEEKKNDKKEDKNVLKSDKLKPQLTSVEKKRYENIGLEFAKGTQKIFKEIRQAEELKQKMSTKKLDEVKKEDKENEEKEKKEKKEGGLGSLFLKLGLAIGAVAIILETFKDKIEKIIPGFSVSWDNFTDPIKNVGNKILNKITEFLQGTIGDNLSSVFKSIGDGILIFFTSGLPNAVFQSGQIVAKAFGANVTNEMIGLDASLGTSVEKHLLNGQSLSEAMTTASNPFADDRDIHETRKKSGLTALGVGFTEDQLQHLGELMMLNDGYTTDKINSLSTDTRKRIAFSYLTPDVANAIMHVIHEQNLLSDNVITAAELDTISKHTGINFKDDKGNFRSEAKVIFGVDKDGSVVKDGAANLITALNNYTRIHTGLQNQPKLQEKYGQLETTIREDGYVVNNKDNKLEMTVEPIKVAQDVFVSELSYLYEIFDSIFSGDDFSKNVVTSAVDVVKYAYEQFLDPFITITEKLLQYCSSWADIVKQQKTQKGSSGSSGGVSTSIPTSHGNVVNITNTSGSPVVVIDFSLNETVVSSTQKIASTKQEIINVMKSVNSKLQTLKILKLSDIETKNLKEINELKTAVAANTSDIGTQGGRITYIEKYLEETDGQDDGDVESLDFDIKQAQPPAK